jgi:hypothetical protein
LETKKAAVSIVALENLCPLNNNQVATKLSFLHTATTGDLSSPLLSSPLLSSPLLSSPLPSFLSSSPSPSLSSPLLGDERYYVFICFITIARIFTNLVRLFFFF